MRKLKGFSTKAVLLNHVNSLWLSLGKIQESVMQFISTFFYLFVIYVLEKILPATHKHKLNTFGVCRVEKTQAYKPLQHALRFRFTVEALLLGACISVCSLNCS
jgi:hypothetical protein